MPTRLTILAGDGEWTAEMRGKDVALTEGGADLGVWNVAAVGTEAKHFEVVSPDGIRIRAVADLSGDAVWVQIDGQAIELRTARAGRHDKSSREADVLAAPMPATVTRIAVAVGDAVERGDLLIALEAMKMELPIHAPKDGVVRAIHCQEGELVQPGEGLIDIS